MRGTTSRYSLVWQCLSPFDVHCPAAALSGAAGGRRNIGLAMPLQTVDMYQLANDWSVWAASWITRSPSIRPGQPRSSARSFGVNMQSFIRFGA